MPFEIAALPLGTGLIAICQMPGRNGSYAADLAVLLGWSPDLVITMTPDDERHARGAQSLPQDLAARGVGWLSLPVADFGVPSDATLQLWPAAAARVTAVLSQGGRVLVHCMGGCGRSGMAILRLMIEMGEAPAPALMRLRAVRPCAVETEDQYLWATRP